LLLSACAKPDTAELALNSGFHQQFIQTERFKLASYQKIQQPQTDATVYIEGDGRAWIGRNRLSYDPSPRTPTVMQLAALDPSPNVIYLARPCQYSAEDLKTVCESKYWSVARYSEVVLSAIDQALTQIRTSTKAKKLNLVGYSGGASLAVLVAARRSDIASIRTVAGNLDLLAMEHHHHTTPLSESLDPISVASKVKHIPQLHFVGEKDQVVPKVVVENFVRAEGLDSKIIVVLPKASHNKGWIEEWPRLVTLEYIP